MDLEKKSQAIKMSWIAKLFDEKCTGKYKYTMTEILNQYKQANFGKSVFKTYLNSRAAAQLPTYYCKLLTAWDNFAQERRCKPSNIIQILTEPLFDNPFITFGSNIEEKRLIFYPNWCKNKIIQIENITYRVIPRMLPTKAIEELLSMNDTRKVSKQYSQIWESILREWRCLLRTMTDKPDDDFLIKERTNTEPKLMSTLNCKAFYNALVEDEAKFLHHDYKRKWLDTLGTVNWEKTFKDLQKRNFDHKANNLRWKIIHRCILTAHRLAGRSPLFNSNICQVCQKYEENLTHLFFLCDNTKGIWNYVSKVI